MLEIRRYKKSDEEKINRFVLEESANGTFLQTPQFLNYHKDKFEDASFIVHKSETVLAFFPGNKTSDNTFVSHQGSTFGGPVLAKKFYKCARLHELVKTADTYFKANYKKVLLKITPQLFTKEPTALLEYLFESEGYTRIRELSAFVPLNKGILENCEQDCRRIFKKSENFQTVYRNLETEKELETFYTFLEISKAKYHTKPVHTLEELLDLKKRIPDNILFKGLFFNDLFLAGFMLFQFTKTKVMHAQYIAVDPDFKSFQATTCLYIKAMEEAKNQNFNHFSFGISTEEQGTFLNENLFKFKESFGAKGTLNVSFEKEF